MPLYALISMLVCLISVSEKRPPERKIKSVALFYYLGKYLKGVLWANIVYMRLEHSWIITSHIFLREEVNDTHPWPDFNVGWSKPMVTHQMETSSALLALCAGNPPVTGEFPSQRPVTLMFSLICAWTNGTVKNRYAGDLRHHRVYYDGTVMVVEFRAVHSFMWMMLLIQMLV